MVTCAIKGCGQRTGGRERVRLFCIPSVITRECDKTLLFSRSRRVVWLERINLSRRLHNIKDLHIADIKPHMKVCSKHFLSGQPSKLFEIKSVDWAPSNNIGIVFEDPVANQEKTIQELSETIKKEEEYDENTDEESGLVSSHTDSGLLLNYTESPLVSNNTESGLFINYAESPLVSNNTESGLFVNYTDGALVSNNSESITGIPLGESGSVHYNKVKVSDFAKIDKRNAMDDEDMEHDKSKKCKTSPRETWTSWNDEPQHEPQVKLEVFDDVYGPWGGAPTFCSSSVQTEVNSSSLSTQTEVNSSSLSTQTEVNSSIVSTQGAVCISSIGVQTDLAANNIVDKREFNRVTEDNVALRAELQNLKQFVMSENQFAESNTLVRFYTGLPTFTMLKQIFDSVSSKIPHSPRYALSQFQEFLIVIMRLRLNLLEFDLGFRFGVSKSTVCKINDRWLRPLSMRLEEQIPWPERDACGKTMTESFKNAFGSRRVVIISCFKVNCVKYKQQNRVRFIIAITPNGKICFISKGVVGPQNDKFLTEDSGILGKLLPGDVLIVDKSLDISCCTEMCQPNPNFPIFSKGTIELPNENELSYTTTNVRTYVERINSGVKQKFRLLQSSVSKELLTRKPGEEEPHIDYIVRICCALTNLCSPYIDDL